MEKGEEPREWRCEGSEVGAQGREGSRRVGSPGTCVSWPHEQGLETCQWRDARVRCGLASV